MFKKPDSKTIDKAKKNFIHNEIEESQSCTKKLWKAIKSICVPSKSQSSSVNIGVKNENYEIVFDGNVIASQFNSFVLV